MSAVMPNFSEPQRGSGGGLREGHDAVLKPLMADVGEELVIHGRIAVLEREALISLGIIVIRPEFQRAQPCINAHDLRRQSGIAQGRSHFQSGRAFPRADFQNEPRLEFSDEFAKCR